MHCMAVCGGENHQNGTKHVLTAPRADVRMACASPMLAVAIEKLCNLQLCKLYMLSTSLPIIGMPTKVMQVQPATPQSPYMHALSCTVNCATHGTIALQPTAR
jgi:hypothetical protein